MRTARAHSVGITTFRQWPEVDRLLAIALQEFEDGTCSGCGQPLRESMDGDLLDEWTTLAPHRCGACTAIARAVEVNKDREHTGALRYIVGLREGWQARKAKAVAERAARAAVQNP